MSISDVVQNLPVNTEELQRLMHPALRFCNCQENDTTRGSFCKCAYQINNESIPRTFAWLWSTTDKTSTVRVSADCKLIWMHGNYSNGNAVIRGDTPMVNDYHYYWEVRIMRAVYGASTMIGVATSKVPVNKNSHDFSHFLGSDDQSWGLTSHCMIRHNQENIQYHERAAFNEGTIVGVYLNMWEGTLEYYVNRRPLGVAFRGLRGKVLFPVVSTTSARGLMQLCYASATPHSLAYLAFKKVTREKFQTLPYGLKLKLSECWWLFPQRESRHPEPKPVKQRFGIRLIISNDTDDDEFSRNLRARMRSVMENTVPPPVTKTRKNRKKASKKNHKPDQQYVRQPVIRFKWNQPSVG